MPPWPGPSQTRSLLRSRGLQRTTARCAAPGNAVTGLLTLVSDYVTYSKSNLALRDAVRVMPGGRGECGARGRGLISLTPGRSGHHACRHYDRHARCVAGSGCRAGGHIRRVGKAPTKPGPDRTKGPHTPWAEPWWNAGRRARPIAEGAAQAALSVARPARRMRAGGVTRVCRRSAFPSLFAGSEPQRVAPQQLAVARSGLVRAPIPVVASGGRQTKYAV